MAQLPNWWDEVSDRLIDIQIAAERGDGRLLSLIHGTQKYLEAVDEEINGSLTAIRTGKMPKRLRLVVGNETETPSAA